MSYGGGFLLPRSFLLRLFRVHTFSSGKTSGKRYVIRSHGCVASRANVVSLTSRGREAKLERTLNILAWRDYSNMARMMKLHEFVRIVDIIGGKSESK